MHKLNMGPQKTEKTMRNMRKRLKAYGVVERRSTPASLVEKGSTPASLTRAVT